MNNSFTIEREVFDLKTKKLMLLCSLTIIALLGMNGCTASKSSGVANELTFSLNGITKLEISYDEEKVTFFTSDSDTLTVKEYMTVNNSRYYAKVDQRDGYIHISEGKRPFFKDGFERYIEVYLPATYNQNLTVTTTNGNIDMTDIEPNLSMLRVDSTSGTIKINNASASDIHLSTTSGTLDLGDIQANQIRLETTSGNLICSALRGNVNYTSTSGNAEVKSAFGSGSYKANNSGKLDVTYTKVDGDLSLFNKNDGIVLVLPADLDFYFEGTTKNGSISTTFQECIAVKGRTMSGTVGSSPTVTVKVETNNGEIQVEQK